MNGVEILNTIHSYASLIDPIYVLGLGILGLVISVIGICTVNYDIVQKILNTLIAIVGVGLIAGLIGVSMTTDEIISTTYQVTISDEVSMTEFLEHYEVIDQDGKIFTVREKTNEE